MSIDAGKLFGAGGIALLLVAGGVHCATAADRPDAASCTYKDALRKGAQAGKPVMLPICSDYKIDRKRLEAQLAEIPR